jgi:hypothetical protein
MNIWIYNPFPQLSVKLGPWKQLWHLIIIWGQNDFIISNDLGTKLLGANRLGAKHRKLQLPLSNWKKYKTMDTPKTVNILIWRFDYLAVIIIRRFDYLAVIIIHDDESCSHHHSWSCSHHHSWWWILQSSSLMVMNLAVIIIHADLTAR